MDGNKIDLITLISVIVFVVALFKLRNVLGRRTGDDEGRMERARAEQGADYYRPQIRGPGGPMQIGIRLAFKENLRQRSR